MAEKPVRSRWSLRRKILLGGIFALIVLGLALGLGLGLTIGRDDNDDENATPTSTASPSPSPTGRISWKPTVGDTWQIVLQGTLDLAADATSVTPTVSIFDIDLFETPTETIDTLHRLGKKVICYFSAGSYEPGRPDSDNFKDADKGSELDGWPGERWLKLDSENVRNIMRGRVELAHQKNCDAVDPDNVDGYQNENGLALTPENSVSFMSFLSNITTPLNLTLGLKNAGDIIPEVLSFVDFSVNEQCVEYTECEKFSAFIENGKPVFHIEYPDGAGSDLQTNTVERYCEGKNDAKGADKFSTLLKKMDLDGWVEYCDQDVAVTTTSQSSRSR